MNIFQGSSPFFIILLQICFLALLLLVIGHLEINLDPFSVRLTKWRILVGISFLVLGVMALRSQAVIDYQKDLKIELEKEIENRKKDAEWQES